MYFQFFVRRDVYCVCCLFPQHLRNVGLWQTDPRLRETVEKIRELSGGMVTGDTDLTGNEVMLDKDTFYE